MQRTLNNRVENKSNFEILKQYIIPADVLSKMLKIYQLIGRGDVYKDNLKTKEEALKEKSMEVDVYFLSNYIGLNLSDTRMRLLITKNSTPRTKEEKILVNLKSVVKMIRDNAKEYTFNGSDLLSYLNIIFGQGTHKFSNQNPSVSVRNSKNLISNRLVFEKTLEAYHEFMKKETFENLHLSMVAYLEMSQIKPFNNHNELSSLLALYYMLLRSNIDCFEYVSFFEILFKYNDKFISEQNKAVINYPGGYLQLSGMMRVIFEIITDGYEELKQIVKEHNFEERAFKSDTIIQTIKKLPSIFTKDEIRLKHPQASESTINRVLTKMRDDGLIKPLGTGRSAKWIKVETDDLLTRFGKENDL